MKQLLYLLAKGLAAFEDFAVGFFIAVAVTVLSLPLLWQGHVLAGMIGMVLAVLPDFDMVFGWNRLRPETHHHESPSHWAIPVLALTTGTVWIIASPVFALIVFLCLLWHYIHDTHPLNGWGLPWLAPFEWSYWSLTKGRMPRKKLTGETAEEENDRWISKNWLRPSALSLQEIIVGSLAFGLSATMISGSILAGLLVMFVIWSSVGTFWAACSRIFKTA